MFQVIGLDLTSDQFGVYPNGPTGQTTTLDLPGVLRQVTEKGLHMCEDNDDEETRRREKMEMGRARQQKYDHFSVNFRVFRGIRQEFH